MRRRGAVRVRVQRRGIVGVGAGLVRGVVGGMQLGSRVGPLDKTSGRRSLLHGLPHPDPVTGNENDGSDLLGYEIVDLVGLGLGVVVRVQHESFVAMLLRLALNMVSDHTEIHVSFPDTLHDVASVADH